MNVFKGYKLLAVAAVLLFLQGCSAKPVQMGVSSDFERLAYDMQRPKKVSVTASGFQLLLFIPISINDRHQRAYAAIKAQAGNGLISDVRVQESWSYAFVGTVYKTTIDANIYPRKQL